MTNPAINEVTEPLERIIQGVERKRLTVRLVRSLLPAIEAELANGTSHELIFSRLQDGGYEVTWAYYKLMLHRVRKEAAAGRRAAPMSGPTIPFSSDQVNAPSAVAAESVPPAHRATTEVSWDVKSPITW